MQFHISAQSSEYSCVMGSGLSAGQLPEERRRQEGQRRHHLHAHDTRTACCHGKLSSTASLSVNPLKEQRCT